MARLVPVALTASLAVFCLMTAASAHTANISSSRIVPEGNGEYRVEVGFLGSDIERMFAENKSNLKEVDLTEPGVIEGMLGKFIQSRVALQNGDGQTCPSTVVFVGEDPTNPYDSKAVLRMDCSAIPGQIFYNPYELLKAQGPRAKHLVSIGEKADEANLTEAQRTGSEPAPGQVMIYRATRRLTSRNHCFRHGNSPQGFSRPALSIS